MQSPPLGLDVAVHKSPSMCGCREVSCSKKSPWDVHPMTGHTSWSCTQPPAATPSEDGAQPLCALVLALLDGLLPTSPECNHSFNRGGIKLLSCSPAEAPLHHSCLQPETGAARASLPSWAEALQLIRLSLPHHGRQWDQSVPNPCYRSGFLMRWILPVQAGCDPEPLRGQSAAQRGPQAATNPTCDMLLHRHVQTDSLG